jgi:hypothetical protein
MVSVAVPLVALLLFTIPLPEWPPFEAPSLKLTVD